MLICMAHGHCLMFRIAKVKSPMRCGRSADRQFSQPHIFTPCQTSSSIADRLYSQPITMSSGLLSMSRLELRDLGIYAIYVVVSGVVIAGLTVAAAVLYQYFAFNSCPPGTRPLPSPRGRLPIVGHRYLINPVYFLPRKN